MCGYLNSTWLCKNKRCWKRYSTTSRYPAFGNGAYFGLRPRYRISLHVKMNLLDTIRGWGFEVGDNGDKNGNDLDGWEIGGCPALGEDACGYY